jgi:hypothetical protein
MATVSNTAGIFNTFGYDFDDPNGYVQELSADTQEHLNTMPAFITSWQAEDIINNDYTDYYTNPLDPITSAIFVNAQRIINIANTSNGVTNLTNVANSAVLLSAAANNFSAHTSRISGLTEFTGTDTVNPYLNMAINFGKTAMYITYQTDGIKNNAPIMGSFTSLLIKPQLTSNNDTLTIQTNQLANSIVVTGNTATSNLTVTQINTLNTQINLIRTVMDTRRTSDVNFYTNLKAFLDGYNKTKKFNNMGETEKYLVMNFIGTEKTKARIS